MGTSYQIRNQEAPYFLTFQVVGWVDVFSRQAYRDILTNALDYARKYRNIEIYAYVIMTNHLHLIARSKTADLSGWVRDYKKFTAKKIMDLVESSGNESRKEWHDI